MVLVYKGRPLRNSLPFLFPPTHLNPFISLAFKNK